ncbi:MAG: hypothetical protein BWY32_02563 [bacterium ADurb.Bin243]|nr:MAG: hypothetical protein BWY32_02563 [bacterium ADurb.Bin243]
MKQLNLRRKRQFRDFIQKDHSVVCQSEFSGLIAFGIGKRALYISKKFRFQKSIRKCAAVDYKKRVGVTGGNIVYRLSYKIFSAAGRPFYKNVAVALGNSWQNIDEFFYLRALTDNIIKSIFFKQLFFSLKNFFFHRFYRADIGKSSYKPKRFAVGCKRSNFRTCKKPFIQPVRAFYSVLAYELSAIFIKVPGKVYFERHSVFRMNHFKPLLYALPDFKFCVSKQLLPLIRIINLSALDVVIPYSVAASFKSVLPSFVTFLKCCFEFFMLAYIGMNSDKRHYISVFVFKRRHYHMGRKRSAVLTRTVSFELHIPVFFYTLEHF